jgi:hypothetical protein
MATKETVKKAEVKEVKKTIKNEVKETTKETTKETAKEVKKTRNESMKVSKETPKKETTKEVPKKISAGKAIREMFESILPKLAKEHLEILTSQEKTKEVLKIRYPFLKEVKNEKDERKINGHARYNKTIVKINDKDYYICNDLYERNIETFKAWCESLK